jgi:hypothetical protein
MPRPLLIVIYMIVAGFAGKFGAFIISAMGAPDWAAAMFAGTTGYSAAFLMEAFVDRWLAKYSPTASV